MFADRKQIRLVNFDYSSQGAYFITICSHDRKCTFGTVVPGDAFHSPMVRLSALGEVIRRNLDMIHDIYPDVRIEKSVIMPNHVHLLIIVCGVRGSVAKLDKMLIPKVIQSFKASVTRQMPESKPIWQTRYHDHIIRDEQDFQRRWMYIDNNPASWIEDRYYS